MSTRRSLFVFGALLAVGVLLAPQVALAQQPSASTVSATAVPNEAAVLVAWTENGENITGILDYQVTCVAAVADDASNISATTPALVSGIAIIGTGRAHEQKVTGLAFATAYTCGVRGRVSGPTQVAYVINATGGGNSDVTTGAKPAAPTPLAAPTGLNATAGDEMVTLTWNTVTDATGYKVQWRTASQDFGVAKQTDTVTAPTTGTTVSHEVDDLTNGMEYMFQVMATDAGGDGTPSREVKQTPEAAEADKPVAPHSVKLTPKGRDQIAISWKHGLTATNTDDARRIRYDVGWTNAAGTAFSSALAPQVVMPVAGGRTATIHTAEKLEVGKSYLIAVRAVAGDASGKTTALGDWVYRAVTPTTTQREMTPAAATTPQNVTVMSGDGELMVTWDEVATVAGTARDPARPPAGTGLSGALRTRALTILTGRWTSRGTCWRPATRSRTSRMGPSTASSSGPITSGARR